MQCSVEAVDVRVCVYFNLHKTGVYEMLNFEEL